MLRPAPLGTVVLGCVLVSGCGDFKPTPEELSACERMILKYGQVEVSGDHHGYNLRTTNWIRTLEVIYPETAKRPGFACTVVDGTVVAVVRNEQIFPSGDKAL